MAPSRTLETLTPPAVLGLAAAVARLAWWLIRVPLAVLMGILEPVISFVLGALSLLLVLTALFLACVRPFATIPFWGMVALAVGLALLAGFYRAALRRLAS